MKHQFLHSASVGLPLAVGLLLCGQANTESSGTFQKEETVVNRASGSFDVELTPQATVYQGVGAQFGRMSIEKQFRGELNAASHGEMLSATTSVKGSAGYVAIEWVSGSLNGRSGSFALQHSGTMDRGKKQLTVSVVPDSGTGQLEGLSGTMDIKIEEGKHYYELEYALPNP
jgi:hypothetical protein